jgi:D-glycero-D-manno-heptose 1,7-bisphosphate phosphatase
LLLQPSELSVFPYVPTALRNLKQAGFLLILVTNQAVVARGLITEAALVSIHQALQSILVSCDAPPLDGIFACPHHPKANLLEYRRLCDCRKPNTGLLTRASAEHRIDCGKSFLVGDRVTDIMAGNAAGCTTIQVLTGEHDAPEIEHAMHSPQHRKPHHTCGDLLSAADWILEQL